MNPMAILKIKPIISSFKENHPKFRPFVSTVLKKADAGSVIEIKLTTSQNEKVLSNIKLTEKDIELIREFIKVKNS